MEGTDDIPNKNSISSWLYWTESDGVFAEIQNISYSFIVLKHIPINSQFWKLLSIDADSPIVFFWGTSSISL